MYKSQVVYDKEHMTKPEKKKEKINNWYFVYNNY